MSTNINLAGLNEVPWETRNLEIPSFELQVDALSSWKAHSLKSALASAVAAMSVVAIAVLGILMTLLVSWGLSRTWLKGETSVFSLELPLQLFFNAATLSDLAHKFELFEIAETLKPLSFPTRFAGTHRGFR